MIDADKWVHTQECFIADGYKPKKTCLFMGAYARKCACVWMDVPTYGHIYTGVNVQARMGIDNTHCYQLMLRQRTIISHFVDELIQLMRKKKFNGDINVHKLTLQYRFTHMICY